MAALTSTGMPPVGSKSVLHYVDGKLIPLEIPFELLLSTESLSQPAGITTLSLPDDVLTGMRPTPEFLDRDLAVLRYFHGLHVHQDSDAMFFFVPESAEGVRGESLLSRLDVPRPSSTAALSNGVWGELSRLDVAHIPSLSSSSSTSTLVITDGACAESPEPPDGSLGPRLPDDLITLGTLPTASSRSLAGSSSDSLPDRPKFRRGSSLTTAGGSLPGFPSLVSPEGRAPPVDLLGTRILGLQGTQAASSLALSLPTPSHPLLC